MKFYTVLMDLIPVEPITEAEIVEKTIFPVELSTALIAAGIGFLAVALISYIIKKNKK
ncbi:MAG: hypothetical protein IKL57_02625 [Oscillospiraceae bacterium]|nr:hypothetical protein [Oscillospiraceae bacterium]MBR2639968.1 hypothetical protein [Oscillospiraceae bacterium]MBR3610350.1 hypothetical protein [Oscillospiraceae bacterium]